MPRPPSLERKGRWPYWATMLVTALTLGSITVAFVLIVLPRRFVLQGDLRASGVSFPTTRVPFEPSDVVMQPSRPVPDVGSAPAPDSEHASLASGGAPTTVEGRTEPGGNEPAETGTPSALESVASGSSRAVSNEPDTTDERTEPTGPAAPLMTDLENARIALEEGDLVRARSLYEAAVADAPHDPELLLEWADVLQYRLDDLEGARRTLERRAERVTLVTDDRFRIAQLHVWTGSEAGAVPHLEAVLASDPGHSGAWALLGDIHRWAGHRSGSANAYDRALAIDPASEVALAGSDLLAEDTRRAVESVDSRRARPTVSFFRDSDGFERLEARAYASILPMPEVIEVEVGARRLEGIDALGALDSDDGVFAEGTAARWWREGQLRTALALGAEHSTRGGTDIVLGARLDLLDLAGWNLDARFRSGPAHSLTSTLGSVSSGLRADQVSLGYYRALPAGMELSGAIESARLSGGGVDATRLAAGLAFSRTIETWLRTGLSSRYIRYSEAAPTYGNRSLFWDPHGFWSTGLLLEVRTPRPQGEGVFAYIRTTPGIALADERDAQAREWIRQFEMEGGLRIERRQIALTVEGFYTRGREGGYTSNGITLGMELTR